MVNIFIAGWLALSCFHLSVCFAVSIWLHKGNQGTRHLFVQVVKHWCYRNGNSLGFLFQIILSFSKSCFCSTSKYRLVEQRLHKKKQRSTLNMTFDLGWNSFIVWLAPVLDPVKAKWRQWHIDEYNSVPTRDNLERYNTCETHFSLAAKLVIITQYCKSLFYVLNEN